MMTKTCAHHDRSGNSSARAFQHKRPDWYRRLHAWALSLGNTRYEQAINNAKVSLLSQLSGKVLEIGPGTGINLKYFSQEVDWIGIEPNPYSREYLRKEAERLGRNIEILAGTAEYLPLPDNSLDAVVSSLVLCSVPNPTLALSEIRRVLRPGGRFVFIEHIAAEPNSALRKVQRIMRGPQALLGDGCCPDRETLKSIETAGFAWIFSSREDMPVPLVSPHLIGYAIR